MTVAKSEPHWIRIPTSECYRLDHSYSSQDAHGMHQIRRLLLDSGWRVRKVNTYAAPGTDYAPSVRQVFHLPLEPGAWEKMLWFPLAWAGTYLGHGSELVTVAVPAEC